MSLYHARRSTQSGDTGKFRRQARIGTTRSTGGQYRDWHYEFVSHQTGTSVRRTSYGVSISDPKHNQVDYLRGFANLSQAAEAAQEFIDRKLS